MAIQYLLDTDTLSLLERGNETIYRRIQQENPSAIAISVISVEEQMRGRLALLHAAKTRQKQLEAYSLLTATINALRLLQVVPFTETAVIRYEKFWAAKLNVGKSDLKIAAIAIEQGATLITRNHRDFSRIPGLTFEDWSQPVSMA